jgi:hypothetical protein
MYFLLIILTFTIILVIYLNKKYLIKEFPKVSINSLKRFKNYDYYLGWEPKKNESFDNVYSYKKLKKKYFINFDGSRTQPQITKFKKNIFIQTFGDSTTFCNDVEQNETFQSFLESNHGIGPVKNFGVGNYGIDQSLLRAKKKIKKNNKYKKKVSILFLPLESIERVGSVYKHYLEFNNIFGIKPRFLVKKNKLILIRRPFKNKNDLLNLKKYKNYFHKYDDFKDFFYESVILYKENKFELIFLQKEILFLFLNKIFNKFLYYLTGKLNDDFLTKRKKNNYQKIWNDKINDWCIIAALIVKEFFDHSKKNLNIPIFIISPQGRFYNNINNYKLILKIFSQQLKKNNVEYFDFYSYLKKNDGKKSNADKIHLNKYGNVLLAKFIRKILLKKGLI